MMFLSHHAINEKVIFMSSSTVTFLEREADKYTNSLQSVGVKQPIAMTPGRRYLIEF
jgi:hypothetical protein